MAEASGRREAVSVRTWGEKVWGGILVELQSSGSLESPWGVREVADGERERASMAIATVGNQSSK